MTIYLNVNLNFKKNRFRILRQLAAEEDIDTSVKSMRRMVQRWQGTGRILKKGLDEWFLKLIKYRESSGKAGDIIDDIERTTHC